MLMSYGELLKMINNDQMRKVLKEGFPNNVEAAQVTFVVDRLMEPVLKNNQSKHDDLERRLTNINNTMEEGFKRVDERFERIDQRFDKLETDIVEIKTTLVALNSKIDILTLKIDGK